MAADPLAFVEPMMPTLVAKPPEGDRWTHEIKYDGYRTQIVLAGSQARAYTRRGHDWSDRYKPIIDAACDVVGRDVHLDGEIIVQDEQGRSDFRSLRRSITSAGHRVIYYAFDLLFLDGRDLRREPCEDRRALLADLLVDVTPSTAIQMSESFEGSGLEIFMAADAMGLEGIVSKLRASSYESGSTSSWLKTKAYTVSDLIVVGFERQPGEPAILLVASDVGGTLRYAGRVMVTLPGKKREALWAALEARRQPVPALSELKARKAVWVEPTLPVKVRHLRGEDMLRHATMAE